MLLTIEREAEVADQQRPRQPPGSQWVCVQFSLALVLQRFFFELSCLLSTLSSLDQIFLEPAANHISVYFLNLGTKILFKTISSNIMFTVYLIN